MATHRARALSHVCDMFLCIFVCTHNRAHAHTRTGELKDLRQQLHDMQQVCQREAMERAREQTQHLNALKSLNAAVEEKRAASKGAEEKLAAVQQKLAATELQLAQAPAQTQTQTDKTTDDSHKTSCDVAPAPTSKPPSRPASKSSVHARL
jgi:septal ring factor EnvC (AmiA/AmiB activator)